MASRGRRRADAKIGDQKPNSHAGPRSSNSHTSDRIALLQSFTSLGNAGEDSQPQLRRSKLRAVD
jgi:hypothetical protein